MGMEPPTGNITVSQTPQTPAILFLTWSPFPQCIPCPHLARFSTAGDCLLSSIRPTPPTGPPSRKNHGGASTNRRCQNHLGPQSIPRNPTQTQQGPPLEGVCTSFPAPHLQSLFLTSTQLHRASLLPGNLCLVTKDDSCSSPSRALTH